MADRIDPARRSANMSRVRSSNTGPELRVRKAAHLLGYRFRLQRKDLPGTPDLVFPARRIALFVHGCFWHRHEGCRRTTTPQTRRKFWTEKFSANLTRDAKARAALNGLGWTAVVIWQCEAEKKYGLEARLEELLGPPKRENRACTSRHVSALSKPVCDSPGGLA
jgi:DNA mismatch endonuclease (patch repair protein)